MRKIDNKMVNEIKHLNDNFDKDWKREQKERDNFLNAPENKEAVLKTKANMEMAERIYKLRKKAKLTQSDLASRLRIKQPTYARIENGQNLTIQKIYEIAEACNAKVDIKFHLRHA